MITLLTDDFSFNKNTNTFVAEASELKQNGIPNKFQLVNPKTNNVRTFKLVGRDLDGSGEDVYGFRYTSFDHINLLIIND